MPDFTSGSAYVDGQLVSVHEAKISIPDWGLLHSDATCDVVHVWQGNFFGGTTTIGTGASQLGLSARSVATKSGWPLPVLLEIYHPLDLVNRPRPDKAGRGFRYSGVYG